MSALGHKRPVVSLTAQGLLSARSGPLRQKKTPPQGRGRIVDKTSVQIHIDVQVSAVQTEDSKMALLKEG